MAYAMTKQGSLDNCITYEFMCDTVADMNAIEDRYRTIGTVAIVLSGESGMEVYIAGSDKQWNSLSSIGGGTAGSDTAGLVIHICAQDEVSNGLPDIEEPDETTVYLVAAGNTTGNLYEEYIYVDDAWEKFGAASIDLSNYIQKTDIATQSTAGLVKVLDNGNVTFNENNQLVLTLAGTAVVKTGQSDHPISVTHQHEAAFYGLAKAAGQDMKNSNNAVGTYTTEAASAIRTMIGAGTYSKPAGGIPAADLASGVIPTIMQSNWNQADSTAADFIKNKPFGTTTELVELIPDTTAKFIDPMVSANNAIGSADINIALPIELHLNQDYILTINNETFTLPLTAMQGYYVIGVDGGFQGKGAGPAGMIFETQNNGTSWYATGVFYDCYNRGTGNGNYTFSLSTVETSTKKLALSEIDIPITVNANKTGIQLDTGVASGPYSIAIGSTTATGNYSVALGYNTTASAHCSCALGYSTNASNGGAVAQGDSTIASGSYSHAEGQLTIANGLASHAEGLGSQATGEGSHAEGYYTIASGARSQVSGKYNVADSIPTPEGWDSSKAYEVGDKISFYGQIVTCVKPHTNQSPFTDDGTYWKITKELKYATIIGNGTADNARSNAYALDWDGNGYFAGDIYVGCNVDSTGGIKLPRIPEAPSTNGTYILQATVTNGTPTYSWVSLTNTNIFSVNAAT